MLTIRINRTKSIQDILQQMDRIYKLYGQGYGSQRMLDYCDQKVYLIIRENMY